MAKSIACNSEAYGSFKKDLLGSLESIFNGLFEKSHLVNVCTRDFTTFITFNYVDEEGLVRSETIRIPEKLFKVE